MVYVVLVVILALAAIVVALYNGLIRLKNRVDEAWSDIDVQLKRRYDLIPNLINTVKGYATHEQETLQNVVEARNAAMAAQAKGSEASKAIKALKASKTKFSYGRKSAKAGV